MRKLLLAGFIATTAWTARAYDFIGNQSIRWSSSQVELVLQLDDTREPMLLLDGNVSWDEVARETVAVWNSVLPSFQFTTATGFGRGDGNDRNEVFFSPSVYGHRFGRDVLAVTTTWYIGSERVEGDVIFNDAIEWDSYSGELRGDALDFRRVALHEFGHVVGLDHPDQVKQVVPSIMNSSVSDLETLTDDDVRGAQALYTEAGTRYSVYLEVEPPGSGSVIPNMNAPDGKLSRGTLLTLKPQPSRGYRFNFWEAPDPNSSRLLKLRIYENQTVRAHFVPTTAPRITAQPRSRFASEGEVVVLRVNAANAPKATYQWFFEGIELPFQIAPTLTLPGVTHDDSGLYHVIVRSTKGETRSKPARLVVDGY